MYFLEKKLAVPNNAMRITCSKKIIANLNYPSHSGLELYVGEKNIPAIFTKNQIFSPT